MVLRRSQLTQQTIRHAIAEIEERSDLNERAKIRGIRSLQKAQARLLNQGKRRSHRSFKEAGSHHK